MQREVATVFHYHLDEFYRFGCHPEWLAGGNSIHRISPVETEWINDSLSLSKKLRFERSGDPT